MKRVYNSLFINNQRRMINDIKINIITLTSTDYVTFDNIEFNNCSYLQLLIDDIDVRSFNDFDDVSVVFSELYASTLNSGNFLIFTCACGIADDGGWDYVNVTHKENIIKWSFFRERNYFFEFSKESYIKEINKIKAKNTILIPEQVIFPEI